MARHSNGFQTIRSEGGLLPSDLLRRVMDPRSDLEGTGSQDYGLPLGDRVTERITQSWNRLQKHWNEFREGAANLAENEPGTGITNEKWSLPLLKELDFGLIPATAGPEIEGRTYAINRFFGPVPIHLIGCGLSLDRRTSGVRGAALVNPHGLVQEFLNRSAGHTWAIVSNGLRLRILRDNQALSRQSYLEFDLEAMFDGEVYSDFVLFWLMTHATRFTPLEADRPENCWLERWTRLAQEQGTRALGELRGGVERALQVLGEGFTNHPKNTSLRDALRTGKVKPADLHGQLLRVIYRLIFLFVAEDRTLEGQSLLHPRDDSVKGQRARETYAAHYSTARLRELADKIKGTRHGDLWRQFQNIVNALSGDSESSHVRDLLALPALGSFLWDPSSTAVLNEAELSNCDFQEVLRHLAFTPQDKIRRSVDFKNLGAEELGGVYESLLALTPQISADGARFGFAEFAGSERKTSGSYYTPDSLVQCLLDSALDPVVEEAIKGKKGAEAEEAILSLKVCDPAVGSGHFLVGAAHRLARHLARVRAQSQGESEPSPLLYQQALRDVIGRCLYGVDINPMSAELCRVGLWLEALEPGKPLSFLDHHIRVGNSLLGTTPELISSGIPDDAFKPIEGDDKKVCSELRKRNKQEREGQQDMLHLMAADSGVEYGSLADRSRSIEKLPEDSLEAINKKANQYKQLIVSPKFLHAQRVADSWCAAFVWPKEGVISTNAITTDTIRRLEADPNTLSDTQQGEVNHLSNQYQFFHWHLAFPEVFTRGGFDCVLGNPPWERVKLQEKEWFAERDPEIANAPNAAARKNLIKELKVSDPELYGKFQEDSRKAEGESHLLRNGDYYPLCGRGDINLYTVFAERMRNLLNEVGHAGCVLPIGIATDDTTKFFFQEIVNTKSLHCLYMFENEGKLFPSIDHRVRFALVTMSGHLATTSAADIVFGVNAVNELSEAFRHFTLSANDIALLNPNTRNCPIFRSKRDAELTKAIYRRVPVLIREGQGEQAGENPWEIKFSTMFHMANDSHLFRTREQLEADEWRLEGNVFRKNGKEYLPLYEAKMIHQFDHRWGTYEGQTQAQANQGKLPQLDEKKYANPWFLVMPRYWVETGEVITKLTAAGWQRPWLLGFRNITGATVVRTVIASLMPVVGVGHSCPIILPSKSVLETSIFAGIMSSFVLDYSARQKIGGANLTYGYFNQLPVIPPGILEEECVWSGGLQQLKDWFGSRVFELVYTAWDLQTFAEDYGFSGPPFRWDEERRFLLRCELDAAFFHLYLMAEMDGTWKQGENENISELEALTSNFATPKDAVSFILDTFPIVRQRDEEKWGDYRTKRVILEIYDAMQEAIRTGQPYKTLLDPPPTDPRVAHLAPGQERDPDDPYLMIDLLHIDLAGMEASVRLDPEIEDLSDISRFRFLESDDEMPTRNHFVIVRHQQLVRDNEAVNLAFGKIAWLEQRDTETGESIVLVTVRGQGSPATLRLSKEEWLTFRPLAVRIE